MRNAMGMPPRDKSRQSSRQTSSSGRSHYRGASTGQKRRQPSGGPVIPKEYAEDVEYTEIRSYSEDTVIADDGGELHYASESQVSDAEILEIKKDK